MWLSQKTSDFNATSVENFFSHSQNVVCLVCAATGATPTSGSYKVKKKDGMTCEKCNVQKGVREFRVAQNKQSNKCKARERIVCAH